MNFDDYPELKGVVKKAIVFKENNCLTYDDLSRELGFVKSHIQRVFTMQSCPSIQFLIRLSRFMKMPLEVLFADSSKRNEADRLLVVQSMLEELAMDREKVKHVMNFITTLL